MSRRYHYKSGPLAEANEELDALWRRIDALEAQGTKSVVGTVGTTETEIRHELGRVPKNVHPLPQADARVWETRAATETSVFLAASVAVSVKVQVS